MTHPIPFYKVGRVGYSREPTSLLLGFIVSTFHLFYLPFTIPSIVAEAGLEPAQPSLAKGFSYHTCFYTSNLNAFYYAIHFIGAGVSHLLFKILWSRLFHYHEKNLASWQYTLSSISKSYHLLMLCFYMYTTISLLGISSIVCTPFMKMLNPYISVVCDCYQ